MKIFQTIQMQYDILGITLTHQTNQRYPSDKRVFHGFLLFGGLFCSHFVYIFHVASSFTEYMDGICTASSSIIIFVFFASKSIGKSKLFKMIDNIEGLIDTSKTISSHLKEYRCKFHFLMKKNDEF